jgi:hypothetical protein
MLSIVLVNEKDRDLERSCKIWEQWFNKVTTDEFIINNLRLCVTNDFFQSLHFHVFLSMS